MSNIPPAVQSFLLDIRQHPMFPLLLRSMEQPKIPRFRSSQAEQVEKARAEWIYQSGRKDQHDRWIHFLTGEVPRDGDDPSQQEKS